MYLETLTQHPYVPCLSHVKGREGTPKLVIYFIVASHTNLLSWIIYCLEDELTGPQEISSRNFLMKFPQEISFLEHL